MGGRQLTGASSPPTIFPVSSRFCDELAPTTLTGVAPDKNSGKSLPYYIYHNDKVTIKRAFEK
jgi:hypothetical protein